MMFECEEKVFGEIPRYLGYYFNIDGTVLSCLRSGPKSKGNLTTKYKVKKLRLNNKNGYATVWLRDIYGKKGPELVHRMILEAFRGPCPVNMESRHLDGCRTNNRLDNLCWGTKEENGLDKIRHGTSRNSPRGEYHGNSKLTKNQVIELCKLYDQGVSQYRLAETYQLNQGTISRLVNGKRWNHIFVREKV
jgi:hypothetical protein